MEEKLKKQLNELLKNNREWPMIIEGQIKESDFLNACFLSAKIPSSKLGVYNDVNGMVKPEWVSEVESKKDKKANLIVIDGIDQIPFEEQLKFKQLLHHKAINGFDLPSNAQIVLLVKTGNREKINREILSLCLYYKVD